MTGATNNSKNSRAECEYDPYDFGCISLSDDGNDCVSIDVPLVHDLDHRSRCVEPEPTPRAERESDETVSMDEELNTKPVPRKRKFPSKPLPALPPKQPKLPKWRPPPGKEYDQSIVDVARRVRNEELDNSNANTTCGLGYDQTPTRPRVEFVSVAGLTLNLDTIDDSTKETVTKETKKKTKRVKLVRVKPKPKPKLTPSQEEERTLLDGLNGDEHGTFRDMVSDIIKSRSRKGGETGACAGPTHAKRGSDSRLRREPPPSTCGRV